MTRERILELCKKYIEWDCEQSFTYYAKLSQEEFYNFNKFMNDNYGYCWTYLQCKEFINNTDIYNQINEVFK